MSEKKPILLKGIVPNPWSPSIALFEVELNLTDLFINPLAYMSFKEGIEDRLNALDVKYAKRESMLRGRPVDAEYKTLINGAKSKTRIRVLKITPYPSRFISRLNYIRTAFYGSESVNGVLPAFSKPIAQEKIGRWTRTTVLVPEAWLPGLRGAMKELDTMVDELQQDINTYEKTEDFQALKNYILEGAPSGRWSKNPDKLHTELHYIQLNPWPIVASSDFIDTFTDEETKKQVRETLATMVEQTVQTVQKDLKNAVATLVDILGKKVTEKALQDASASMFKIRNWMKDSGTYQFIGPSIAAVEALIDAYSSGEEQSVSDAAFKAGELFGVSQGATPKDTLQAIQDKLSGEVDPRIRMLIRQTLGEEME